MTINEIKNGLDICSDFSADCHGCPYFGPNNCGDVLKTDAHDLIIEQENEIKQLKTECTLLDDELRIARQDTIDVLNKLKGNIKNAIDTYYNKDGGGYYLAEDVINDIDELIKEVLNAKNTVC